MILGKIFAEYLKNTFDINSLKITSLKKLFKNGYLQSIVTNIIIYEYGISKKQDSGKIIANEENIRILKGRGDEFANYIVVRNGEIKIPDEIIPDKPQYIIHLGFAHILEEEEKISLKHQIQLSVTTIREYLCDYNLKLIHVPDFLKIEGRNKVGTLNYIPKEKAIVLNPYGDIVANERIIRDTKFFIIGGIVDKGRRLKNATSELAKKYGYDDLPQVRILLRDSMVGVPDRINKIIEILLKVLGGSSLEEAIITTQSNADKISRLIRELNMLEKIDNDTETDLKNWLKVSDSIFRLAVKKSKFRR